MMARWLEKSTRDSSLGLGGGLLRKLVGVFLLLGLLSACTTPDAIELEDLSGDLKWDDLLEGGQAHKPEARGVYLPSRNLGFSVPRPPDNLHRLIHGLSSDQQAAQSQIDQQLIQTMPYEGGILGARGFSKVFIAPTATIRNFSRLYWVMVKVLSEKYGCFMVAKQYYRGVTRVWCRDRRQIVFWQSKSRDWIQFATRQYDKDGFEIAVRHRKIVRISPGPMLL